ncbi:sensor histidine kinase [Hamadaea tsunoensis]|uniref:sensor histidine kinase n=1 Tax=Hamadaea tsunoensis TaxID=53368 RepID=UPI0003FB65AF|nr:HAMP domain-containing sensor histidine kinase [Hamadaea tsunoensis]
MGARSRSLLAELTATLERVNAGGAGLPAIGEVLEASHRALGALGAAASEYVDNDGRVIAASGIVAPFVGIRFDGDTSKSHEVRAGSGVHAYAVEDIQPLAAEHLKALGVHRLLVAGAQVRGRVIASITAVFGGGPGGDPEDEIAIMRWSAAVAAHLYLDQVGLPILGDGLPGVGRTGDISERGLFIAMASHELRTPVTVIKGYADTLNDHWDQLDPQARMDAIRVIGQRSGELARLVDRLLTSAVGGPADAALTSFDMVEALRTAVSELPASLRRRLVVQLPARLPPAWGLRADVEMVLTELVTNGDKYSTPAEPVTLSAGADEGTVYYRVADRGVGVRPDEVELAFERYWQGTDHDITARHGVGLGLYLVRKTIERQNGWVSLRPRDGGGTVAEVRLPRGDRVRSGEA